MSKKQSKYVAAFDYFDKAKSWKRKHIKDIRNIFKLKKELNYRAIKDIRNLFRLEK